MPSKKKKYNARFPAGRIKKIMQSDEEVGKVAQAVPIIISRTLELFVESLLQKTLRITNARNAKTLSTSHMKQCIMSESRFDFLRELVKNIPDINIAEEQALVDNCPANETVGNISFPLATTSNCSKSTPITSPNGSCVTTATSSSSSSTSGIVAPSSSHRSNGNKRNFQVSYLKTNPTTFSVNQQSTIPSSTPQLSELQHNVRAPGFYKDHYTDSSDKTSVIQYSPKLQTQKSTSHLDVRPPKLKRVDSAPAGANMYLNSPYTMPSPNVPSTPPAMKIYFSNSTRPNYSSAASVASKIKNVPPLTPLKVTSSSANTAAATATTTPATEHQSRRQSIGSTPFVYPSTSKEANAPIIKIDVSNTTPVVKIDYSNLSLPKPQYHTSSPYQIPSTSTPPSSLSSTSTSAASLATKSAAMINIDMLNSCSTKPFTSYNPISTITNTLEMDEDYDNI